MYSNDLSGERTLSTTHKIRVKTAILMIQPNVDELAEWDFWFNAAPTVTQSIVVPQNYAPSMRNVIAQGLKKMFSGPMARLRHLVMGQ